MKKFMMMLLVMSSLSVFSQTRCESVFIPNSFTPNNDGMNDVWNPVYEEMDTTTFAVSIFDRSGSEVFRTDEGLSWDGVVNGYSINTNSTYVYRVVIDECVFTGVLNLIK